MKVSHNVKPKKSWEGFWDKLSHYEKEAIKNGCDWTHMSASLKIDVFEWVYGVFEYGQIIPCDEITLSEATQLLKKHTNIEFNTSQMKEVLDLCGFKTKDWYESVDSWRLAAERTHREA